MKLRHHVIITTGVTLFLFILALAVALFGMQTTKNRFQQFIEVDQALLNEETTMYAQGLQMGQALRNIVMEPSDQVAYRNLDNAAQIFENALEQARQIAHADPKSLQRLAAIASIRQRHIKEQEQVKAILHNQPAAIRAVRENETPVWREMRALLIESINEHRENVAVMGQEMQALSQTILSLSLLLGVIGLIVSAGLMTWLAQHILRLIGGDPAEALQVTSAIAKGDFTQTITLRPGDQNSLLAAMNTMQNNLIDMASRMQQTAESIDTAAQEISLGNVDLSARTESQAAGLEETAAAMEELTSTVRLNADNAHEANRLAAQAADKATQGGQAVAQAVRTMNEIRDGSERIVDIIGVIDGIAFQTNILALNAAVEAARAGEAGRGFAVVASEVRSLAQRSASAAQDVKALIDASVERIAMGNDQISVAGDTVNDVVQAIKEVATIMDEITHASQEQSVGIGQIGTAVRQIDDTTQQNAALVQQASAATQSLEEQAGRLKSMVAEFKLPGQHHPHLLN